MKVGCWVSSYGAGVKDRNERGMMRSLTTFDPATAGGSLGRMIPRPTIPVLPVLASDTFARHDAHAAPAIVDQSPTIYVTAGRIAIAHGLALMGVRPGDKVLIPAYHCAAMVEPLAWVSAKPVFFALRGDLSADFEDIATKLDRDTRLLIMPHYFGIPQDMVTLRGFCDRHGLRLIEDCAHSFFGSYASRPLGTFGDCAVGSLTKFFPVRDGGCLVMGDRMIDIDQTKLRSQSMGANLAALLDAIDDALYCGRLEFLQPLMAFVDGAKSIVRKVAPRSKGTRSVNPAQLRSGREGGFDATWTGVRASFISRAISRAASRNRIVERRRRNYLKLVEAFSGLRQCRPIFPELSDGAVPYMFPLWIEPLADVFSTLEDRGVPMQRFGQFLWPGVDEEVCRVSTSYSRHLIQLPCHQELTESEIHAIIAQVRPLLEA